MLASFVLTFGPLPQSPVQFFDILQCLITNWMFEKPEGLLLKFRQYETVLKLSFFHLKFDFLEIYPPIYFFQYYPNFWRYIRSKLCFTKEEVLR